MLHIFTAIAWQSGKFWLWNSSKIYSVFFFKSSGFHWLVWHNKRTFDINRDGNLRHLRLWTSKSCRWSISSYPLFRKHVLNSRKPRRKCGEAPKCMIHRWIIVCRSTSCNSSGRTFRRKSWYKSPLGSGRM